MKNKTLLALGLAVTMIVAACDMQSPTQSISADDPLLARGGNGGQTAFTTTAGTGTGDFIGYNETDNPDYGIYSYTLWAGKTNDAGVVEVTNDDENIYVTYNTNETADLKEVHVYLWTSESDIPSKRPAPGQADYVAENINSDSYTVTIPMELTCGDQYYISTHAALIANDTADDEPGVGSNDGETAYAAGTDLPEGFSNQKGAWWGYVTYTVECFYDLSGTVYEDANNSGNLESGESGLVGITVTLYDSEGNVVATTTTDADGSYLFEHVPGGADYYVESGAPIGDYQANENAGGTDIFTLDSDTTDVDFGFVPLYDVTVHVDFAGDCSGDVTVNLDGNILTLTGAGSYTFENNLPGMYTLTVSSDANVEVATFNEYFDLNTDMSYDFTFVCNTNDDNDGNDDSEGNSDYFPTWGQDISHVILVYDTAPAGDNDGYYTVKIDEWPDAADNDLDNSIEAILAYLLTNDDNVTENSELLGASIKGGQQITSYYAYGSGDNGSDTPPVGLGFSYDGTSANESPQNAIDAVYLFGDVF